MLEIDFLKYELIRGTINNKLNTFNKAFYLNM